MPNVTLATVYIAGTKHYAPEEFYDKCLAGDSVKLKPEPDNAFDSHAVEVFWQDKYYSLHKVGYVPRTLSKEISTYIAAGRNLRAEIAEDAKPKITIFEEREI